MSPPASAKTWLVGREGVVDTAGEPVVGDFRRDHRVRGIGKVEDHHAVAPVRRALAGHGRVAAVGRDLHVVDRARVDLDRVGLEDVAGIGHVPHEAVAVGALGPRERVVAPVPALEDPEVGGAHPLFAAVAVDLELLDHVAGDDLETVVRAARGPAWATTVWTTG